MFRIRLMVCVVCVLGGFASVRAEVVEREDVVFEITQTTVPGQSVFVLGDIAELGGGDVRRAVKLTPSAYPTWQITVAVPFNTSFTYQYYLRTDSATTIGNAANGTPIGGVLNGQTGVALTNTKVVIVDATFPDPVLHWRQPAGDVGVPFTSVALYDIGPGASGSERRWSERDGFGETGKPIEVYVTSASGPGRIPSAGTYTVDLDAVLLRQTGVFSYAPASLVSAQRQENFFNLFSTILGETRPYRVLLPRGYDEHTDRSYPVLYMHDGQNVFDIGPFGSWEADEIANDLIRTGRMREIIIVGIDNTGGNNRFRDYVPDGDPFGQGQNYAAFIREELKPIIDATYRTLPGSATTGSMGSSLGGICALYHVWDHGDVFGRAGSFSGAWSFAGNFVSRVNSEANPAALVYLDSGNAGTSNDAYSATLGVRDALARKSAALNGYAIEGALRYVVGFGDQHNEAAWSARLPGAFSFLYPVSEEPYGLAGIILARQGDVNDDNAETVEDLYSFEAGEGPNLDVLRDGVSTMDANRGELRSILRAGEMGDVLSGR